MPLSEFVSYISDRRSSGRKDGISIDFNCNNYVDNVVDRRLPPSTPDDLVFFSYAPIYLTAVGYCGCRN